MDFHPAGRRGDAQALAGGGSLRHPIHEHLFNERRQQPGEVVRRPLDGRRGRLRRDPCAPVAGKVRGDRPTAAAAEPTRLWLLTFIVAKSALIAWASTLSSSFGSSRLQDLRGWVRKSPILGLGLITIAIATVGWPGSAVFEARSTLVRLALPSQLQFLGLVGGLGAIAYYGRLIAVGLLSAGERVGSSEGERPRWPAHSAPAEAAAAAAATDPAPVRAPKSARTRATKAATAAAAVTAAAVHRPNWKPWAVGWNPRAWSELNPS